MTGQWGSSDYARLNEVIHDSPLPELVTAISRRSDRRSLALILDAEVQRREKHLQLIREYCNLLNASIHILPPELLSHIFFLSASDEDDNTLFYLGWTSLLLVCRHWRDVAYSTPALWSYLTLEPSRLMSFPPPTKHNGETLRRVSLQRQRVAMHPVHARIFLYAPRYDEEFFAVCQPFPWEPGSLESLRATGRAGGLSDFLTRMNDHFHPLLRCLDIQLLFRDDESLPAIPDEFFDKHTSLRELIVMNMVINFRSICCLQSLNVTYGFHDNVIIQIDEILDALLRCPSLRDLRLTLPRNTLIPLRRRCQQITLTNLESVWLRGTLSAGTDLLLALRVPAYARVTITSLDEAQPQDVLPLATYLKAHLSQSHSTINSIHLREDRDVTAGSIVMSFYPTLSDMAQSCKRANEMGLPLLCIGVVAPEAGVRAEVAAIILSHFPVTQVGILDLVYMSDCHSVVLRSLFEYLPALTTVALSFGRQSLDQFLKSLNARLAVRLPPPVTFLFVDASYALNHDGGQRTGPNHTTAIIQTAKKQFEDILRYCSAAKTARMPLDLLEISNDGDSRKKPVIVHGTSGSSKKRLWRDLTLGFVHNGVIRNRKVVETELGATPHTSKEYAALLKELSS